jgi:5-methylcytosine-specific restriction endonuclease McrA
MRSRSRSERAEAWQAWYSGRRWRSLRAQQLAREPLCERCRKLGRTTAATVVHHVERHNGDPVKFFAGPFESLCKQHHDGDAQSEERLGYSTEIGLDGFPVDPKHPVNARESDRPRGGID